MKHTLQFMLVLGNVKMIATKQNGHNAFYSRVSALPSGRRANLKKLASCLSARI